MAHHPVYFDRIVDEVTRSDVTITAAVVVDRTGAATGVAFQCQNGPGMGPHFYADVKIGRRIAWSLHKAMDALTAAVGAPDEPEPDPQLTLDDAPLTAGHHPTIKIGAK